MTVPPTCYAPMHVQRWKVRHTAVGGVYRGGAVRGGKGTGASQQV